MLIDKEILWDDRYKLNIDAIDIQHKQLFVLVGKLYALDDIKNTKNEFKTILNEFNKYIKNHFDDEEKYMLSIKYPELEWHKQLHQDLINKLTKTVKSSSKLSILKIKMRIIAKRILIEHIVNEDIKIKLFKMSKINDNLIFDSAYSEDEKYSFDITNIMPDV
ncbi:MAG: hemerythrin family protein [Epsilonproteobacteria bacterium]|nr:hemerythrin family protein [Campylobacterota bacterium]